MGIEIPLKTDEMILIPKTWGSIIYHHQRGFHLIQFDHLGISVSTAPMAFCQHLPTSANITTPAHLSSPPKRKLMLSASAFGPPQGDGLKHQKIAPLIQYAYFFGAVLKD